MAAFCYKNEEGDVFGVAIVENLPEEDINSILDLVSVPSKKHIPISEFEDAVRGKYITTYPIYGRGKDIIASITAIDGIDIEKGIVAKEAVVVGL